MPDISKILNKMTLRQKLAQLTQLSEMFFLDGRTSDITGPMNEMKITQEDINCCGSVIGAVGAENIIKIQKRHLENDPNKIPLIFMLDVIHGFRTMFPINLALGCSWDPELMREAMEVSASEAAAAGISLTFAPMADLVRDTRWGRVMESTGEDPYLNSLFAAAAVKGYQGDSISDPGRIASCVKHIAAYGAAEAGREYNTTEIGLNTLFEFYMPAYRAAIEAGSATVMSAFNALNGVPSTGNKWLMRDILRDKWGFNGAVISDWGAVVELINHGVAADCADAAELGLKAGVDIEMMTSTYLTSGEALVRSGRISEDTVDEAVMRILKLKKDLGLFDDPYRGVSPQREKTEIFTCENLDKAYDAAVKSAVLLKNENAVLPLKSGQKVAVLGPFYDTGELLGEWFAAGKNEDTVTLKSALENGNYGCDFEFSKAADFGDDCDEKTLNDAVTAAKNADVIIFTAGEKQCTCGEAESKTNPCIPRSQIKALCELKKLNKPIVSLVISGRPLVITELDKMSDSVLEVWFPGTMGGRAIADLVFGVKEPTGRLTMSMPYCVGQCPIYYNGFSTGRPLTDENKDIRFTSKYIDAPNEPLYPFGWGLGYSTVNYCNLTVKATDSGISAGVTVKNTGDSTTCETVQLYIRDCVAPVVRPVKQLKGFKKVTLSPNEEQTVRFELDRTALSYYTADGDLNFDPGEFIVSIGPNSKDALKAKVSVSEIIK